MSSELPQPESLLPHRLPMMFVREILELRENSTKCLVSAGEPAIPGYDSDSVPAVIGIEYMAQAAALLSGRFLGGECSGAAGASAREGAIVAVRDVEFAQPSFRFRTLLLVEARLSGTAGDASIFECLICEQETGRRLASGKITVVVTAEENK